jgi:hypothetical protein
MFIPVPDFYPFRIQQQYQKRRGNFFVLPFFCSHKYHNFVKKFFSAKTLKITVFFNQNFVLRLSKICAWDPGSKIRDPEKTYSGSLIPAPWQKMHRIPDPDPQQWNFYREGGEESVGHTFSIYRPFFFIWEGDGMILILLPQLGYTTNFTLYPS